MAMRWSKWNESGNIMVVLRIFVVCQKHGGICTKVDRSNPMTTCCDQIVSDANMAGVACAVFLFEGQIWDVVRCRCKRVRPPDLLVLPYESEIVRI